MGCDTIELNVVSAINDLILTKTTTKTTTTTTLMGCGTIELNLISAIIDQTLELVFCNQQHQQQQQQLSWDVTQYKLT